MSVTRRQKSNGTKINQTRGGRQTHGSRTSSTQPFVNAARPALAVISVGQDSPHGHPHAEVLRRWRDSSVLVLTTGQRGTITVSTDGEDLRAETFVRQQHCESSRSAKNFVDNEF